MGIAPLWRNNADNADNRKPAKGQCFSKDGRDIVKTTVFGARESIPHILDMMTEIRRYRSDMAEPNGPRSLATFLCFDQMIKLNTEKSQ